MHDALATSLRLIALISGVAVWISQNATAVSVAVAPLERLRSRIAAALDLAEHDKASKIAAAERHLEQVKAELSQAVTVRDIADRELRQSQMELERIEKGGLVGQFIERRSASEDYRRHLGIVALVRGDFNELTTLVQSYNTSDAAGEPTGIGLSRIVLYIDDLDRCPPERVVEVLQAIHLLLAFKLFVVVVGVDARWVTYSLKEQYKGMLVGSSRERADGNGSGKPASPYDYLEKIFQIPYWITPMNDGSSRSLLRSLVPTAGKPIRRDGESADKSLAAPNLPSAKSDGPRSAPKPDDPKVKEAVENYRGPQRSDAPPTRVTAAAAVEPRALEIGAEEADAMQELAGLIGRSPRSVKRFVNVYRLLRAALPYDELALFSGSAGPTARFRPAMLLLAFAVGLPELMDDLVMLIERAVAQGKEAETLDEMIESISACPLSDPEELKRLQAFRKQEGALADWGSLSAEELVLWTDRIVQYSFIPPPPPAIGADDTAPSPPVGRRATKRRQQGASAGTP